MQAEVNALAATELEQLKGPADLPGPVPVEQRQEGQPFGGGFALGVIGVAGSREIAMAKRHGLGSSVGLGSAPETKTHPILVDFGPVQCHRHGLQPNQHVGVTLALLRQLAAANCAKLLGVSAP